MTNLTKTKGGLFARFCWRDTVFLLTVGTLLVWSLSMGIISGTFLQFGPAMSFVRIFVIMAVLRAIFRNKYTLIFTGAIIVVAGAILFIDALLFTPGVQDAYLYPYLRPDAQAARYPLFIEITNLISGSFRFLTGFEFYTPAYDAAIQWMLIIGLSIFVFVFGFFWFNFLAILSTVLVFGIVFSTGFFSYTPSFYVFVFCVIAYLIKHLNLRSMGKEHKTSPFALYALPFTAVCLAVAIALPAPRVGAAADFTENFIRRPFNAANDALQSAFAPRHFSLAQTGFGMGNTRRLGGNVTANYDHFMRINHPGPIYLTGNIFDRYTGFSWINSFNDDYYFLEFTDMQSNIEAFERVTSPLTMHLADDFFEELEYSIEYIEELMRHWYLGIPYARGDWLEHRPDTPSDIIAGALATRTELVESRLLVEHDMRKFTVFTTGLVSNIAPPNENTSFFRDANGAVQSDVLMARRARYVIYYADLPNDVDRTELLATSRPGLYSEIYSNLREFGDITLGEAHINLPELMGFIHNDIHIYYDVLLRDFLIPRAERINEIYTELPEHFPERVKELAQNVIELADATTSLDKAIALNNFLRNNDTLQYTLTPGNTPLDRDFVDHFLFDLQMGYCTHFASSFVTMARAVGLPARYVEGFIVTGNADMYGYLIVINRQGHAWAEVYFEGYGWHRFDPTPPAAIFTWPYAVGTIPFYHVWDDYYMSEWGAMPWPEFYEGDLYWDGMHFEMGAGIGTMDMNQDVMGISIGRLMALATLITLALAVLLLGTRAAYFEVKKMSVTKKSNNEAAVAHFHQILRYMRLFRYEIEPHETAMAFGLRIGKRISFENDRAPMVEISQIFSRARYGYGEISDEDRQRMAAAVKSLDKRMLGYMGPRKYVFYKYVLCVV